MISLQHVEVLIVGAGLSGIGAGYQACAPPQCGHSTDVDTGAANTKPQWQVYVA